MVRFEARELRSFRVLPILSGGVLGVTVACSGGAGMGPEISAEGHEGQAVPVAHVDIEYSRNVSFQSSRAIAHFVYAQGERSTRGAAALSAVLTGARSSVPEPGRCQDLSAAGFNSSSPVELLEAGMVTIRATPPLTPAPESQDLDDGVNAEIAGEGSEPDSSPDVPNEHPDLADDVTAVGQARLDLANSEPGAPGERLREGPGEGVSESLGEQLGESLTISLAPRAFPGVSSVGSGVMYTSRDREIPLPAGAEYEVEIEGSLQVPAMTLRGTAPAYLTHVTVGGTPLEQVTTLNSGSPIDITWDIGLADDLIVVDVTDPQDGRAVLRCSYSDAAGAGTVPWVSTLGALVQNAPHAGLRVHRLRVVETTTGSAANARGELRFDFELTRTVEFR